MLTFSVNATFESFIPVYNEWVTTYGRVSATTILLDEASRRGHKGLNGSVNERFDKLKQTHRQRISDVGVNLTDSVKFDAYAPLEPVKDEYEFFGDSMVIAHLEALMFSDEVLHEWYVERGYNPFAVLLKGSNVDSKKELFMWVVRRYGFELVDLNPDLVIDMLDRLRNKYYPASLGGC